MDRITDIELQLKNVLLSIDGQVHNTYEYYNDVTVVNIDDEALATEYGDFPTVCIYLDPNELVLKGEYKAFRNKMNVKLVGTVSNDEPVQLPKFEVNKKMNELLGDIKAVLSQNPQLNNSCDRVDIKSSKRVYHNDILRAGDIIVTLEIFYSQSRINPDLNVCV